LVCENTQNNWGYITEKIILAYLAGSIPIYCGSENIFKIFKKNSLLYINNPNNIDNILSEIKKLNNNYILYYEFISREIISKENFDKFFKCKYLKEFIINNYY